MTKSPKELTDRDLEAASAGWGRHCYYSYSSNLSASYPPSSSENTGSQTTIIGGFKSMSGMSSETE